MTGSMVGHSLRVGTITETGGGEGLGVTGRANSIRDAQIVE
jgi:hypothetical protein